MGNSKLPLVGTAAAPEIADKVQAALERLLQARDQNAAFVVTRSGVLWVKAEAGDRTAFRSLASNDVRPTNDLTPCWDRENRLLTVGGRPIKQYRRSSPNQEAVLQAFEEQGWPYRIDDPLPFNKEIPAKLRLHDTIRWLNLKHESRLIRFLGDGTGEGVCWKLTAIDGLSLHDAPAEAFRPAA